MEIDDTIRDCLDYDPITGVFTWKRDLGRRYVKGTKAGALDKDGYTLVGWKGRHYRGGRLAWWFIYGVWPECEIDHINRVRNDDRLENLRPVSRSLNRLNRRCNKKKNPYPSGVSFKGDAPRAKPWCAQIRFDGKVRVLGLYASMQEASKAYETARAALLEAA